MTALLSPASGVVLTDTPVELAPGLWLSALPARGPDLARRFDVLALCAREAQSPVGWPGLAILPCPLEDGALPASALAHALGTASSLALRVQDGQRVLVACLGGRNRSAFVAALTLRYLRNLSGTDARRLVQARRPGALSNAHFTEALERLLPPSLADRIPPRPQGPRP